MWITHSTEILVEPINEIELYLRVRRKLQRLQQEMAKNDNRHLKDFGIPFEDKPHSSIVNHVIQANNF